METQVPASQNQEASPSKKDEIVYQNGKLEIPTSLIIAIVTCLMTTIGSCSMAAIDHFKAGQTEDQIAELKQAQIDIATMKKDIEWIRITLEADRRASDSPKEP